MKLHYACELPIATVSEANSREHWHVSAKRHTAQQWAIRLHFCEVGLPLPCIVKFSRISPRVLDDDNLTSAFKWIRDEMAKIIIQQHENDIDKFLRGFGRYDSDSRIKWEYAQEKGSPQRIRIEIFI
jgi:hypothetical protein